MDFEKISLQETDDKYQLMLEGKTPPALSEVVLLESYKPYKENLNRYRRRLEQEQSEFNALYNEVSNKKYRRLRDESNLKKLISADRKSFALLNLFSIIFLLILGAITFLGILNGVDVWLKEILIPEASFANFFEKDNSNSGFELMILSIVVSIVVSFLILKKIWSNSDVEFGTLVFLFIPAVIIEFFVFRTIFVGLSWVAYFLFTPICMLVLTLAFIVIFGIIFKVKLKRFKFVKFILFAVLIVLSLLFTILANGYATINESRFERENGRSYDTPDVLEIGDKQTIFVRYDEETGSALYYLEFTADVSGKYYIQTSGVEDIFPKIYCQFVENPVSLNRVDERFSYFKATMNLVEGQSYVICVGFKDTKAEGHFQVLIDLVE